MIEELSTKLRKRAARTQRKVRAWFLRRQFGRSDPTVVEILEHSGKPLDQLEQAMTAVIARVGAPAASKAAQAAWQFAVRYTGKPDAQIRLHIAMVRALSKVSLDETLRFGDACLPAEPRPLNLHVLAMHHLKVGNHERAIELLDRIGNDPEADGRTTARRRDLRAEAAMEIALRGLAKAVAADDEPTAKEIASRVKAIAADEPQHWIAFRLLVRELNLATGPRLRKMLREFLDQPTPQASETMPTWALADLSVIYYRLGRLTTAHELIVRATDGDPVTAKHRRVLESLLDLGRNGFRYTPPRVSGYTPIAGRVLYLLHNSLPHDSGGYATRTHGLLTNTRARGWNISGVTRLGYPEDKVERESVIDGLTYYRLQKPDTNSLPMTDYLAAYADAVCELARKERPEILHAAANSKNGLVANAVARALGIKSIYEVRGLWEVTRGSREPQWMDSEQYRVMSDLELQAAREADAVVCITRALIDEMVRRGVARDKITLIPNGVDVARFVPRPRDEALAAKLGLAGKRVIGYIGSIVEYEGLDLLMHAVQRLRKRGVSDLGVLIVGDGAALADLRKCVEDLEISDLVVFTGRIPHHEVEAHYSIVDVAPFPRRSLPVTEMVSPLKPFEAMAMEKVVVASSVAALGEMIEPGVNGFVFRKDDIEDLTDVLARALDGATRPKSPRAWVTANRSWRELTSTVDTLYKELTHPSLPIPELDIEAIPLSREFTDTLAAYDKHYAGASPANLRREDYARWSQVASMIPATGSLLDVGIGAGQFVNAMAARGGFSRIVGVDKSKHTKFVRLRDDFKVDYVDIAKLPYKDGEFDVVTCMETIEHLPDEIFERGVAQLRRVCKDRLIVTVPFREEPLGRGHLRRFDLPELTRLFPRATFTLLRRGKQQNAAFWIIVDERLR